MRRHPRVLLPNTRQYYFLVDDETTDASTGTIQISAPEAAYDVCEAVIPLTVNEPYSFSTLSSGLWSPTSGQWGTPGGEQLFSFTPTTPDNYVVRPAPKAKRSRTLPCHPPTHLVGSPPLAPR